MKENVYIWLLIISAIFLVGSVVWIKIEVAMPITKTINTYTERSTTLPSQ